MDYAKQVEVIKATADKIEPYKVTVLTGKNGSGKSVVRKILSSRIAGRLNGDVEKCWVASISMESRTTPKHNFGALSSMGIDEPENPTSRETFKHINALFNSLTTSKERYTVIDEPEIGMGEETVAALVIKLNSLTNPLPPNCLGVLVITHNRYIVEKLQAEFVNMEGMTKDEWLSREIIPTDIDALENDSLSLWREIFNLSKTRKG